MQGLSSAEVAEKRSRFGPNEVLERRVNAVFLFLKKFWGLSAWMLELIAALSWALHKPEDLWVALGLLVVNLRPSGYELAFAFFAIFPSRRTSWDFLVTPGA